MDVYAGDRTYTAQEIIERSSSVAARIAGGGEHRDILFATRNVCYIGYRQEDFRPGGVTLDELVHPDDRLLRNETVKWHEASGIDHYDILYRIVHKEGPIFWIRENATTVRDAEGEVLYTDSIFSNYTEQKAEMEALEDNLMKQDVLNTILRKIHGCDFEEALDIILGRAGQYLGVSRILLLRDNPEGTQCELSYEWCNRSASSLLADGSFVLNYRRDIPKFFHAVEQRGGIIIGDGGILEPPAPGQERRAAISSAIFAVNDGRRRYGILCFDECVSPRVWDENTMTFLESLTKLISTAIIRHNATVAAEHYQQAMETVLDNIPTYIYVTDPGTNRIVYANREFARNFGENPEGSICYEVIFGELGDHCRDCLATPAQSLEHTPVYQEVPVPGSGEWLGMQRGAAHWLDGRLMRLNNCQKITEKKVREASAIRAASLDYLTGLPNRHCCEEDLQRLMDQAQPGSRSGYVLFIDLDDFKVINDGYGHDYGDALLREFACFLESGALHPHPAYRFSGDEFVVMIAPSNSGSVWACIDKVLDRARQPWSILGKTFYCTVSIGVVRFPSETSDAVSVMKHADIAMFEAKKSGKNNYAIYSSGLHNDSAARAEMESMLRGAIADNFSGFCAYFQPYVDIGSGRIHGAEALMRWFGPDGRMILPDEFIPLAEYLGLIIPLGEMIMYEAFSLCKSINEHGHPHFSMSVNVSMRQLQQSDFITCVDRILEETGVDPKNVVLEVTEGVAADDSERIQVLCEEFRSRGLRIAMDDFGTGYSSLSNLRDMPVDIIKVDRSFIIDIESDPYALSFVRIICDLGRLLNKMIVVEGVETSHQMEYCVEAQVDIVQGFYFYRPMPGQELLDITTAPQLP